MATVQPADRLVQDALGGQLVHAMAGAIEEQRPRRTVADAGRDRGLGWAGEHRYTGTATLACEAQHREQPVVVEIVDVRLAASPIRSPFSADTQHSP